MKCPKCKLVSPDDAQRCDCGYDFVNQQMKEPFSLPVAEQERSALARTAAPLIVLGVALHATLYFLGTAPLIQLLGLVLVCLGGGYYAQSRGRSKFWGLLGFFSLVGVVVLLLVVRVKKTKTKELSNTTSDGIRQPADGSPKPSM